MAITVTDIISEYGDYYLNHGQNQRDVLQKLHRPSTTAAEFLTIPTNDTVVRKGTSAMDRVLQPFQKAFTPIGTLTFQPNRIDLFNMKVDKQEYPDEIVDTWVAFLEGMDEADRSKWPFVRWMMEVHIMDQAQEDFELNEVWAGVYAAPTPGTAGAASTSMDGIKQILTDNAAKVNTIAMGAIPTADADFTTYVEEWFEQVEKEHRKRIRKIYMSEDLHLKYRKGKRQKYNMSYAMDNNLDSLIDFPNAMVLGLPSMGTDETIWATLEQNKIRPIKRAQFANFQVGTYAPRQVSIFADWWTVCSFARMESVFRNDL
jgi:hypothetical protein